MTRALVVVLNWNGIDDTEACIRSLLTQDYKHYEVLIIDNGSVDDSVTRIQSLIQKYPNKLIFIGNDTNLGFTGGVNVGIQYAINNNYDAVALLNNDATVDKSWLSSLVSKLSKNVGVVTGLLLHEGGKTIDSTGEYYTTWGIPFPRGRSQPTASAPQSGYVFGATGGATLYKTDLFKKIELFDDAFFAYYEDVDISFRTQLAGYKIYFTDKAIAYHKQGATSKKIPGFTVYQTFKNLPLLFWKNVPAGLLIPVGVRFLLLYWLIFANAVVKGSGWYALKGWGMSVWYFWTRAIWQRFAIQRRKKVDANYIRSILYPDLPPEQTGMRKLRDAVSGRR